ncbi:HEAT repeat domain-containing protein [Actinoplanes sp. NPDC023714]|uniref:HEAT repeat domain-containing protein n=1 Tax=Actinoplanes sp. NPDC023714 TaxID=3154322 RepID=UPI0033D71EB9
MLIGEVARRSGVSARMLRHYESLGLVRPTGRSGSGYREYSESDIRRIFHIESLRSLGLSLRDVGRALDDPGFAPAGLVEDLIGRARERIAAETELLTRLRRIDASEPAGWDDVLRIVALLQALGSESAGRRQRAALSSQGPGSATPPTEALVGAVLTEDEINVGGALRWALAQSGADALPLLTEGLASPDAGVRRRAAEAIARIPGEAAGAVLREALGSSDVVVRRCAALVLGARGVPETAGVLVAMVAEGVNDTEAADALGVLARDPETAARIAAGLASAAGLGAAPSSAGGSQGGGDAGVRRRVAEALAEIPGEAAAKALVELAADGDRAVAVTAAYVLRLRAGSA